MQLALPAANGASTPQTWRFDGVMPQGAAQADVFECVGRPATDHALAGFHAALLAYGQTGTGKTYTLHGDVPAGRDAAPTEQVSAQEPSQGKGLDAHCIGLWRQEQHTRPNTRCMTQSGLAPRVFQYLFDRIAEETAAGGAQYRVSVSAVEIYNEALRDLLAPRGGKGLKVSRAAHGCALGPRRGG